MSVAITYQSQRKVIKVSPNTLFQQVLEESISSLEGDFEISKCSLKYKRNLIDLSLPFRYGNIPNNASLELEVKSNSNISIGSNSAKANNSKNVCRVALSIEGTNGSLIETFDSNLSLYQMLEHFINNGNLSSNILQSSPELIYLRSAISSQESLMKTTFASLGLSGGQSARFQLRHNSTMQSPSIPSTSLPIKVTPISVSSNSNINAEKTTEVIKPQSTVFDSSTINTISENKLEIISPLNVIESTRINTTIESNTTVDFSTSGLFNKDIIEVPINNNSDTIMNESNNIEIAQATIAVITSQNAVDNLLDSNFDRVSIPAITTIIKYIHNLISNPIDVKFRSINTGNKAFQEKILNVNGSLDVFYSIGFSRLNSNSNSIGNGVDSMIRLEGTEGEIVPQLLLLKDILDKAMDKLNIPMEDRPILKKQAVSSIIEIPFNPYQTTITRTSQQPARLSGSESITEKKLDQINKRRRELEGICEDVDRLTEVLMPSNDGNVTNLQEYNVDQGIIISNDSSCSSSSFNSNNTDDISDVSDGRLIASSLKNILKKGILGAGSDDVPLTTKAFRDLEKASKERIFSRTLIRVRFPDRVCIQGYFHPRHTMQDVGNWLMDCINVNNNDFNEEIKITMNNIFELYQSPPRVVIPFNSTSTLSDLKLVPAALIHLSWKSSPFSDGFITNQLNSAKISNISSSSSSSSSSNKPLVGYYLSEALLLLSSEKNDNKSISSYPISEQLVPNINAKEIDSSSKIIFDNDDLTAEGKSNDDKKKSTVPKWMKLSKK